MGTDKYTGITTNAAPAAIRFMYVVEHNELEIMPWLEIHAFARCKGRVAPADRHPEPWGKQEAGCFVDDGADMQ